MTVRNAEDYSGQSGRELADCDSSLGVANIEENHVPGLLCQLFLHSIVILDCICERVTDKMHVETFEAGYSERIE